jgi:hypothetical protein
VRRPVCLAVEWVAWAVWTINPTPSTEMTKAREDSSGPIFLVPQPRQIRVLNGAWSCAETTELCEYFVTFRLRSTCLAVPQDPRKPVLPLRGR